MNNWYQTKDERRRVRQIVAELPSGGSRNSEFANLGLAAKYQMLMTQKWVAGYFRTDADKGPYLLVRADGHVQGLRDCPLRIAFTFYREPSAGLFGLFVAADSAPELQRASPTGQAVFECIYGLDDNDAVERIRDALSKDVVHLCFADKSSMMSMETMDATGKFIEVSPPCCRFDRVLHVPDDFRQALSQQFKELQDYHRSSRRDYQRAVQELSADFPSREHPILVRSDNPKSQPQPQPQLESAPGRPVRSATSSSRVQTFAIEWKTEMPLSSFSIQDVQLLVTDVENLSGLAIQEVIGKCRSIDKPLVVVSPGFHSSALELANAHQIVPIRATPLPGQHLRALLEDLAVFAKAHLLTGDIGFEPCPASHRNTTHSGAAPRSEVVLPDNSWTDVLESDFGNIAELHIDADGCSFSCELSTWLDGYIASLTDYERGASLDGLRTRLQRLGCAPTEINLLEVEIPSPNATEILLPFGYASSYFITDFEPRRAVVERPRVLISATPVDSLDFMMSILEHVAQHSLSLLAIAPRFGGKALAAMVVNKLRGKVPCLAIELGNNVSVMDPILAQLASTTGAKILENSDATCTKETVADVLGTAVKASAGQSYSVIEPPTGRPLPKEERTDRKSGYLDSWTGGAAFQVTSHSEARTERSSFLFTDFAQQSDVPSKVRLLFPGHGERFDGERLAILAKIGTILCETFEVWRREDSANWAQASISELAALKRAFDRMSMKTRGETPSVIDSGMVRTLAVRYVSGIRLDAQAMAMFVNGTYTLFWFTIDFGNAMGCGGALQTVLEWYK